MYRQIRTSTNFQSISNLINKIQNSKSIYLDELTKLTFYFEKFFYFIYLKLDATYPKSKEMKLWNK